MQKKGYLKIWLLCINLRNSPCKLMDGPITALQTLDCDWSLYKFIDMNFSKLTHNNQIFRNDFVCIYYPSVKYHLKFLNAKIFASRDLLEISSLK